MKLILYYMLYCSTMNSTTYDVSGAMSFDLENLKAQTYVQDLGNVTWDITYHQLYYDKDKLIISRGVVSLQWGEIKSVIIIGDDIIEQNINGVEKVLMVKNKYADIKLHSNEVQQAKREAFELIRRTQQSCCYNR